MEVVQNYLRSSSSEINKLLGSSFEPRQIMLIYALFKRGKTNICLDYAVNAAKAKRRVLYIDADIGGVSANRLGQILKLKFGINVQIPDPFKVAKLKGIEFVRVLKLSELKQTVNEMKNGFDLVIIDSLTLFFRTQIVLAKGYGGNITGDVMFIVDKLRAYCYENHAAAIITAQRTSEVKAVQIAEKARNEGLKPEEVAVWREFVGGESLGYYVDLMVEIDYYQNGKRKLDLIESRSAKKASCEFLIVDGGIA